ncbi:MAG TPA: hypothetical protein PKG68_05695 [Bacteroidales bacterium]|nr:hypothetical protein [Bacteroidales bacterium]
MKKTLDINIAGQLFRVDEDAWEVLKHYLDHVSARFKTEQGGDETLADIEARIAEIFGGGKEPPTLVSKEMVTDMINIMGAPEDYYDDGPAAKNKTLYVRKSMYDPNSFSARVGRGLSEFFRAFGKLISAILRVFAIILGALFTLFGFLLFFTFVIVIFFNNVPFFSSVMEPQMTNVHDMLGIVLSTNAVWPILILTALVTLLPLAALIWLGVKLIFRIKERFRVMNIILFLVWIASLCALAIILILRLSVYSESESVEKRLTLDPAPETLWINTMKKQTGLSYYRYASVEDFRFFMESPDGVLRVSPDLSIRGSDNGTGYISVERRAYSNSDTEAVRNARQIEYNWKMSGDTLYLDEYCTLPAGARWNGSMVDIDIRLPEGTEIRFVQGVSPDVLNLHLFSGENPAWKIVDGYPRSIDDWTDQ